jgi:hypothetical protein
MWYNDSIRKMWKIVIINILKFKRIQFTVAVQVPYKLFFLYPYL